jgi:uncharacterized protein HemX
LMGPAELLLCILSVVAFALAVALAGALQCAWAEEKAKKEAVGERDKIEGERDLALREMEAMGRRLAAKDQIISQASQCVEARDALIKELKAALGDGARYFQGMAEKYGE